MQNLLSSGSHVVVVARDKDVIVDLLKRSDFEFRIISKARRTRLGMLFELVIRDLRILYLMRKEKINIAVGTSVSISHMAYLSGARSIIFNEDDLDYIPLFAMLAYPLANIICTPDGVDTGKWHRKQRTYPGYHELAYLHPDMFSPDESIKQKMGLAHNERFALIRLSALQAHHDANAKGLSEFQIKDLVAVLEKHGRVFVNNESELPNWLEKYRLPVPSDRIHDVLAHSTCLVSDSQTMTIEAAVLGVPAFRCNSFVGRCSVIHELEQKYELAYGFKPDEFKELLHRIENLLSRDQFEAESMAKRDRMLADKINVSDWMIDFLQSV